MTYFKDLTKKERTHLTTQGVRTLQAFRDVAALQAGRRRVDPKDEPCGDCYYIAKKLGLPTGLGKAEAA